MNADGMTYYTNQDFNTWKYKDVFSKVHFTNIGLQMNLNVNNFFGPNRGNRRWTVLLSPAVYAQHFSTELINKADKSPFPGLLMYSCVRELYGSITIRWMVYLR